jgi:hypothetical protein
VTWWHLEALAERLVELLPQQLEFGTESADDTPVAGPTLGGKRPSQGNPSGQTRSELLSHALGPSARLGAPPGARKPPQDCTGPQSGRTSQEQAQRQADEYGANLAGSELDIALWPLLYGPRGIWPAGRRRP